MLPKILIKVFFSITILILIYITFTFTILIPNIEKNTIELEENIGKIELQKTVQIIHNSALEMKSFSIQTLKRHKNDLKRLTSLAWQIISIKEQESHNKDIVNIVKKQNEALEIINKLHYNDNDYFFVSDYHNVLISHPYLKGDDFSNVKDIFGNLIIPPMVEKAKNNNEGFTSYWWKKNSNDTDIYEKLSYVKNFKPWKWVVGTGVYIDDIDKDIELKKKDLVLRLREMLKNTKIGQNGYVYIFNSDAKMIIHPDKKLEGQTFNKLKNPKTGRYIYNDLINTYKSGGKKLYYLWDTHNDRGNYIYKKISWIEYDPYFDWYICSSAYLDEFHLQSDQLKKNITYSAIFIILLITGIGLYFLRQILNPIIILSQNAKEVIDGNLNVRYKGIINNDETGILATQFNLMLDTINEQIDTLDAKIKEKTDRLSKSLKEKDILLQEVHHRVKNNLYIISGIIGLQLFQEKEIPINQLIKNIQDRIQAIAMAHSMLGKNSNQLSINIKEYIQKLVTSLFDAYIEDKSTYECIYEIEAVELTIDQTLSCGLIINELVTNSIKYSFKDQNNYIKISLHLEQGNVIICIEDHGAGFDPENTQGIGLEIMEMSVKQLEGSILMDFTNGTKIIITFPNQSLYIENKVAY